MSFPYPDEGVFSLWKEAKPYLKYSNFVTPCARRFLFKMLDLNMILIDCKNDP